MIGTEPKPKGESNIGLLRKAIADIPNQITEEMARTDQNWLVCLGSGLQCVSAYTSMIERSGEMPSGPVAQLKAKFWDIVDLWKKRKAEAAQTGGEISEDVKRELMEKINALL